MAIAAKPSAGPRITLAVLAAACAAVTSCAKVVPLAVTESAMTLQADATHSSVPPGSVIYGVAPPMFGDKPLASVTARLDNLKDLGVDALWLAPVMKTDDTGAISYAITDYQAVRKDYGTLGELKTLVGAAHHRGIKVVLDFVPNHTSIAHPYYKDAAAKGAGSKYWDYYVRDKNGTPQHYFDWSNLINLNYGNPAVQQMMTDAFTYWLREANVDGFRCDAAWGVKDRTPTFWPKLRKSLAAVKSNVFLLAEAGAQDPYYVNNGFDAAYDWTQELGHAAWEHVFDEPAQTGDRLRAAKVGQEATPDRIARFLANNDTGARFITRHGFAAQRVAATLLLTLPGLPIVYNGDEVGAEFSPYDDPKPITWDDPNHLRPLYKELLGLRHGVGALEHGSFTEITPKAAAPGVYAYMRDAGRGDVSLVVLNFGDACSVDLPLPTPLVALAKAGKLVDALGAPSPHPAVDNVLTVSLAATRPMIMVPLATPK